MRGTYPSPRLGAVACLAAAAFALIIPDGPAVAASQAQQVTAIGPAVGTTQSVVLGSTWIVAGTLAGAQAPSITLVTGTYTLVLQSIAGLCTGTFVVSDNVGALAYPVTCSAPMVTPGLPITTLSFGLNGGLGLNSVHGQLVAISTTPLIGVVTVTFNQG